MTYNITTVMCHIPTFWSMTDGMYDSDLLRLLQS